MKANIGLIPLLLHDEIQEDLWGTLEKIAEIGYQGIEGGSVLVGNVEENRNRLASLGLQPLAIGASKDALRDDVNKLVDDASAIGAGCIILYYATTETRDEVLELAELLEAAGAKIAEAGLKLCYHNHDQEFKNVIDGQYAMELLLENTDPNHLFWELDAAWVLYGGEDPIKYLKKYQGRIPLMHLKDIADIDNRGAFTAVGTGILDLKGVVETSVETGVGWAVVEQDRVHNLSPMESTVASFLNIKELGLV